MSPWLPDSVDSFAGSSVMPSRNHTQEHSLLLHFEGRARVTSALILHADAGQRFREIPTAVGGCGVVRGQHPTPRSFVPGRAFDQDRQPRLDPCAAGWGMLVGKPASQLGGSFGHGRLTQSRAVGLGWDADAIIVDFEGEPVVITAYPDRNPLGTGMFRRVADGLLPDAVRRDLDRCWEYQKITGDLEGNGRRALRPQLRAEFGVLPKCREQAPMVKGWWAKSFHQTANVYECGLLQGVQLL
jgi:hypothetical protein